jgi:hypothetical protein
MAPLGCNPDTYYTSALTWYESYLSIEESLRYIHFTKQQFHQVHFHFFTPPCLKHNLFYAITGVDGSQIVGMTRHDEACVAN